MARRRRRIADNMSDNIEDDDATQRREQPDAVDADEDEDQQQHRQAHSAVSRSGPGESSKRAAAQNDVANECEDEAEDATPVFDAESFGNKPLRRHDGQKLQGMASDWNMIESHLKESAFSLLTEVAAAVAEYADDSKARKELERLDTLMRETIDIEVEIKSHEQTLKDLHQQLIVGDEISDVLDLYRAQTDDKLDAYRKKTSRQKYAKSETYAAFKQSIYEVQHPNEAMPPVVEFLPREEGDNSDDDEDDIQVGGVLQDINCPITLTPLVDPRTSLVCQHTFSAAAIGEVLGPNKFTKKKCPASGCNQMICLNDLKPNKELERRVKAYQRRAQRREEDHDAEEIVE